MCNKHSFVLRAQARQSKIAGVINEGIISLNADTPAADAKTRLASQVSASSDVYDGKNRQSPADLRKKQTREEGVFAMVKIVEKTPLAKPPVCTTV